MKNLFKIELGKIPTQYVTMPKFLLSLSYRLPMRAYFHAGRLYQGYVGLLAKLWKFELTIWIHNVQS